MKDRVVQYPNRYKLTPVSGDIYDLVPQQGTVTEQGTPLNKATLLTDATAQELGIDSNTGTVDTALRKLASRSNREIATRATPLYLAFVGNVNQNSLDAAFGKNNYDRMDGLGMALAMYAKFKNSAINIETQFRNLIACENITQIPNNANAICEAYFNTDIRALLEASSFARNYFDFSKLIIKAKSDKATCDKLISTPTLVDKTRTNSTYRSLFNRNRIRILAPGNVSWTVPSDWPTNFVHIQLVGGGGANQNQSLAQSLCGQYKQFTLSVSRGQVLSGSIGSPGAIKTPAGAVTFAGQTAAAGVGANQSGCFLVKASDAYASYTSMAKGGQGGFEGGTGGSYSATSSYGTPGVGDGTLGACEGTGGASISASVVATNGGGGAGRRDSNNVESPGGGGYGGGGGCTYRNDNTGGGGSGAIIITCPDGYKPTNVVYNRISGVTAWRRDTNIFNSF